MTLKNKATMRTTTLLRQMTQARASRRRTGCGRMRRAKRMPKSSSDAHACAATRALVHPAASAVALSESAEAKPRSDAGTTATARAQEAVEATELLATPFCRSHPTPIRKIVLAVGPTNNHACLTWFRYK